MPTPLANVDVRSVPPTQPAGRSFGRGYRLWLACALIVATTLAAGGVVIWELRRTAMASAERELTNLGVALAEQTTRSMQSVDLILLEVQSRVGVMGVSTQEEFRAELGSDYIHQFLIGHARNLPQAEAIILLDANGTLVNWSRDAPAPSVSAADRDYFIWLRSHDERDVFVGLPITGRVTGERVMVFARRINAADGSFLGVVAGLIATRYLEDTQRAISMLPGEGIAVLRRDGFVLAAYPGMDNWLGKQLSPRSTWYDRVAGGGGSYLSPGMLKGFRQIITVHPLRDYPLVVDVDMSEQAALKGWYAETAAIVAVTFGIAIAFGVLLRVMIRQFRDQEQHHTRLNDSASALRESEQKLKAYAEMAADWFWEQDADLRFVIDSRIPDVSLPTDIGKTRRELGDPAMGPARWDTHEADLLARRPFRDFRWERISIDGKRRFMCTSGDPVFDEAGTFLGYHGTGRDVTAMVEAAEELRVAKETAEAANRAKSEFLANMSHELRTPLHSIIGFAELMQERTAGWTREKYLEWSGEILGSGRHLLDVINGVLELSRIEAGRYNLSDDTVDLKVVARSCIGMVRLQAEANRVRLDCGIGQAAVIGDLRAIKQVVLNLLTNAVKFTPADGSVTLRATREAGGGLTFAVTDTGIGIEPAALASLCEPFTQADASISRHYGGTGLGLAISRKLMTLHGGTLTIESTLGQGTTVRIGFPAARVIEKPRSWVGSEAMAK
jgi:signal transduction histidine kinase